MRIIIAIVDLKVVGQRILAVGKVMEQCIPVLYKVTVRRILAVGKGESDEVYIG